MMAVPLDKISKLIILIWVTVVLNIWSLIFTCHFKVRPNRHQIICSRRCKEPCMIKIKALLNNKIIPLWILRIQAIVNKRALLCYLMHQELNHIQKLLGLLKRRPNKRTKSVTCQCSNKIEWLKCLCLVKIKRDQLKNMLIVTTSLWIITLTQLKWCKIMWVYFSNLHQLVQKEIDKTQQLISNHTFHTRPLIKLLSKQSSQ